MIDEEHANETLAKVNRHSEALSPPFINRCALFHTVVGNN